MLANASLVIDEDRPRVLVVDDEDGIRAFLASALTEAGFDVRAAADGLEALHDVRAWHPDVVLLDLVLPRLHGWDVTRACRSLPRPPRIVLMTATPAGPAAARETGADAYLAKPLDLDHVLDLIWALIHNGARVALCARAPRPRSPGPARDCVTHTGAVTGFQ